MTSFRTARPSWDLGLVIVCRTCDGYDKSLRRGMKEALVAGGARKRVRVIESSCLDLCPKKATAVVVVDARGPRATIVPQGTIDPEDLRTLVRDVGDGNESFGTGAEPSHRSAR